MFDALFGSGSPMWAGQPGTGWLPSFGAGRPLPFVGSGPVAPSIMTPLPPTPSLGSVGAAAAEPMMPATITASALVAAVALRRGQPQGPANDQEVEDFLYDALE